MPCWPAAKIATGGGAVLKSMLDIWWRMSYSGGETS